MRQIKYEGTAHLSNGETVKYILTFKDVKNINLRVHPNGSVVICSEMVNGSRVRKIPLEPE